MKWDPWYLLDLDKRTRLGGYTTLPSDTERLAMAMTDEQRENDLDLGAAWYKKAAIMSREQMVKAFEREAQRSEEHTSELQSRQYLVCRLLLEKKKTTYC